MYRQIRKQERKLNEAEISEIIKNSLYGVLSTSDNNNSPYGVPLTYVELNNNLYFHCATEGHKLDNIRLNDKVSFCIVSQAILAPERFNVKYKSVIVFGKASEVFDDEKHDVLIALINKYSALYVEKGETLIDKIGFRTRTIKMSMEHITGKVGG